MSDTTRTPPEKDKTPRSYATEPPRRQDYAPLPPGITVKPEGIVLKHNVFVVSVATMVITSLVIFFIPLFNGLLGGVFGGYHAGRMKRSLVAAALSSVLVSAIVGFAIFIDEQPQMYLFSGLTFGGWVVLHVIGTFIGAVFGAIARPLVTERNLYGRTHINATPAPGSGADRVRSRAETRAAPPSEPAHEV